MSVQARVALVLSLVCGIALGAVAMMYVKNRPHGKGAGAGSAVAAGSGSAGAGSAGTGSAGSAVGSAGSGTTGSGTAGAVGAIALDCAALAKVAEDADKDAHLTAVRGKEVARADKGGSAAMNLAPKYTEITYATTIQVIPGKTAVIHEASDRLLPTEYRVDIDSVNAADTDAEHANPHQKALAKELADKVHACLPTWKIDDTETVDDQTTFHAPDDLAYVITGFGWGDTAGEVTTVSLQVVAEVESTRDVGGSGSGSGAGRAP